MSKQSTDMSKRGTPRKQDLFKIPNILCYIRILMVPLFVYLFFREKYLLSASVAILASITDILDGYIARHFNMKTDWGMFIDPVADKLMQFALLICSIFKEPLILILVIIFIAKEIVMLAFGIFIYRKGRNLDGAAWCGKICTVFLDLSLFYVIAAPSKYLYSGIIYGIITVCSFLLILAFIIYMYKYILLLKEIKKENFDK